MGMKVGLASLVSSRRQMWLWTTCAILVQSQMVKRGVGVWKHSTTLKLSDIIINNRYYYTLIIDHPPNSHKPSTLTSNIKTPISLQSYKHIQKLLYMNQTSQYQFTPLLHTLTYALQQYQQKQHIDSALFQHPIKLAILEKQPNLCLSDFKHSVQAIKVAKEEAFKSHPFNKFNSGFYCILDKKWLSLNAKKESLVDSHENAHPYEPYFHFKEDYEDYRAQRDFLSLRSECQVIVITKWSLKIVNIGNTGYYGVVILMLQTDSRVKGVKFIQNVAGISSVLYEKSMKQMLQRLRLQDLRLIFSKGEDKRAPHSMFYYCQEQESKPKHRPHNILVADTHQKMLAFNPKQPYHLLTFGKVQGLNCLQRPLAAKQINQEKITTMNLENIQIFFNGVKIKEEKGKDQGHKHALEWSSDQESSQERQDAENSDFQMMIESDSSEGQDPLRNLYLKQFDQMKIA